MESGPAHVLRAGLHAGHHCYSKGQHWPLAGCNRGEWGGGLEVREERYPTAKPAAVGIAATRKGEGARTTRRRWVERSLRMKQRRQTIDRCCPDQRTTPYQRVKFKPSAMARARLPDLFCVYFAFLLSLQHQRERERYYGIRLAGWEQMERGHFGWEYLSGNGTLGNWDNSTSHTTHTHTQRMALLECGSFVSWVRSGLFFCFQALGSAWSG